MKKIIIAVLLLISTIELNAQLLKKLKDKMPNTQNNIPKVNTPQEKTSDGLYTMDKKEELMTYKIIFSDKPFEANQTESGKEVFTLKDNIYGRVVLNKPFKKLIYQAEKLTKLFFLMDDTLKRLDMDSRSSGDRQSIKQPLLKEGLNSSFIDFEVWVNKSKKTEITIPTHNFPHIMYEQIKHGLTIKGLNKIAFRVMLGDNNGMSFDEAANKSHFPPYQSYGFFTVDLSGLTQDELQLLTYKAKSSVYDLQDKSNYPKAIINSDFIKTLPLPGIVNAEKGAGYRDPKMTEEEIKKLILNQFNTDEIQYFQFLKPEINSDYSENLSSYDQVGSKVGNKHFLVVFKDKDDKFYRMMECTIVKTNGTNSEPGKTYLQTFKLKEDPNSNKDRGIGPTDVYISLDIYQSGYIYYIDIDKIPK